MDWIKAARLRTLPLSLSGIILGSLIARIDGYWNSNIFLFACLTTVLFQVLSNYANDYGDGIKGTDKYRTGPKRVIQSGKISPAKMKRAIFILSFLCLISTFYLVYLSFEGKSIFYSLLFVGLGIASIVAAIKYTVGKSAYGYYGLGDIFVFLFFGLLAVFGSYFLFRHSINFLLLMPASSVGLLSTAVLNLNNMRDIESDKKAKKHTLVVKIGLKRAIKYHIILIILPFVLLTLYCVLSGKVYGLFFLIFLIPMMIHLEKVRKTTNPKYFDPELKKVAALTFLICLTLGIGINI